MDTEDEYGHEAESDSAASEPSPPPMPEEPTVEPPPMPGELTVEPPMESPEPEKPKEESSFGDGIL